MGFLPSRLVIFTAVFGNPYAFEFPAQGIDTEYKERTQSHTFYGKVAIELQG